MKKRRPFNRLPNPAPDKERAVKQELTEAVQRKRINRVIKSFQEQFRDKSLLQLLPAMIRRCSSKEVIREVIRRIEQNQGKKLSLEDQGFLEEMKKGLEE